MRSWTARTTVTLDVNGRDQAVDIEPGALLLDVLRNQLGLTGARRGCETGYCGACTIQLDGRAIRCCLQLALRAQGHRVTTIEGLGAGEQLHPVQRAFLDHAAMECGYCVPGMVMLASGYLAENPAPREEEVRRMLASNLCRCTGYRKMITAVMSAGQGRS